jgi:hypothetical protein
MCILLRIKIGKNSLRSVPFGGIHTTGSRLSAHGNSSGNSYTHGVMPGGLVGATSGNNIMTI